MSVLGYTFKHGSQIQALLSGSSDPAKASFFVDCVVALAPVVKKHFPQFNQNDLLDDTVALIQEEFGPKPPPADM